MTTVNTHAPPSAEDIVAALTLEQKASLGSGAEFWTTKAIDEAGIRAVEVVDGPAGVRKQVDSFDHMGYGLSEPATSFPLPCAFASTWDTDLIHRLGAALGREARSFGSDVLLAPAMNIRRTPIAGRNWEYISEDPIVTGILATAYINGVQSEGVGASAKHFAANNQETERMRASSDIDERTLREIYLRGFHRVIRDADPWTVMAAFNKVNGVYASQNEFLLREVLRGEWGYEGVVMSDWGAMHDRVAATAAGLDLEMPSTHGRTDADVVAAVKEGRLDPSAVDDAARHIVELARKAQDARRFHKKLPVDFTQHDALAREIAGRSIVLLRNEPPTLGAAPLLPLSTTTSIAVIGELAANPRRQGAGSAFVNAIRNDTALEAITDVVGKDRVRYAAGYSLEGETGPGWRDEAITAAAAADVAVVFLGLPSADDAEGVDRDHLDLPAAQLELLSAVLDANPATIVVLTNGGVVTIPFASTVPAILEAWLLGQAGGAGTADVLFGAVNPSARLPVTIPRRLQDDPTYLSTVKLSRVQYAEGIYVGYRGYDARDLDVSFPFGHGLSYSSFRYDHLEVTPHGRDLTVAVTVTNTSDLDGREVVQVYTGREVSVVDRPPRELKSFQIVELDAHQSRRVELAISGDDLAYWDVRVGGWLIEPGTYRVSVGASSRDIRLEEPIQLEGDTPALPVTYSTSVAELLDHPVVGPKILKMIAGQGPGAAEGAGVVPDAEHLKKMTAGIPIDNMLIFADVSPSELDDLIALANR